MNLTLKISKKGEFVARSATQTQCVREGYPLYRYLVSIEATPEDLDPKTGFIMDVREIGAYFERTYATEPARSCELIAAKTVRDFYKICREKGMKPRCIKARIHGAAGSWIDARWPRTEERR